MGDRSNIVIEDDAGKRVYLYGHWMGDHSLIHARHGLESGRVGDAGYLARIIFSSMVKSDIDGETGFGISGQILDNEYPLIVIAGDDHDGTTWLEDVDGRALTRKVHRLDFIGAIPDPVDYGALVSMIATIGAPE